MRHICCICGQEITGWGNNPAPVCDVGECCDTCNWTRVIPERVFRAELASKVTALTDIMNDDDLLVVVKPVGEQARVQIVSRDVDALQDAVGGYFEAIVCGNDILLLCDENGKMAQKKANLYVFGQVIVGDVLFVAGAGDDFGSLSVDQIIEALNIVKGGEI